MAIVLAACGGVPDNSSPQPIESFKREGPTNAVPVPQSDMDPEALVRAFLEATASPTDGHAAARRFLTAPSAQQWDERGDAIILDEINTFVDQRSQNSVRMRLVGDNVGVLKSNGQLLPASGRVETTISLVRVGEQWLIDGPLPNGAMIDRSRFVATYRSVSLYFTDRTHQHLVSDPRWLYGNQDADPTVLLNRLIEGPAEDLASGVDNGFPSGSALRGQAAQISGGGVRVELTGLGTLGVRDRTSLAAQIIWTLNAADIGGPYVINADGAPLVPERSAGWQPADVKAFDPLATPTTDVGLNIVRDGALLKVTDTGTTPSGGSLGTSRDVRSASISSDGKAVTAVVASRGGPGLQLVLGTYGGEVSPLTSGTSITRPSFGGNQGNDAVWAVVDGKPVRVVRDSQNSGQVVSTVDVASIASIATIARGPITELQVSPDGVRVALIVGGQVLLAVIATNEDGQVTLANPRIAAYNVGNQAVSLSWATSSTLMVARDASDSPVVQLPINGAPASGLISGNVAPPVRAVTADASNVYIGDQRGILRLGSTNGQPDRYWTEVEPAMSPTAIPVLP
ncbi:MtrAB system accessory lipoprotein LpqB [Gordonia sp. w5E2]|uniref:MtrAB system accessory lipoprotein LpqB n=1 Tax=Gordonia sp. w5E2 TaxID=3075837 RepID=UPI003FA5813D